VHHVEEVGEAEVADAVTGIMDHLQVATEHLQATTITTVEAMEVLDTGVMTMEAMEDTIRAMEDTKHSPTTRHPPVEGVLVAEVDTPIDAYCLQNRWCGGEGTRWNAPRFPETRPLLKGKMEDLLGLPEVSTNYLQVYSVG